MAFFPVKEADECVLLDMLRGDPDEILSKLIGYEQLAAHACFQRDNRRVLGAVRVDVGACGTSHGQVLGQPGVEPTMRQFAQLYILLHETGYMNRVKDRAPTGIVHLNVSEQHLRELAQRCNIEFVFSKSGMELWSPLTPHFAGFLEPQTFRVSFYGVDPKKLKWEDYQSYLQCGEPKLVDSIAPGTTHKYLRERTDKLTEAARLAGYSKEWCNGDFFSTTFDGQPAHIFDELIIGRLFKVLKMYMEIGCGFTKKHPAGTEFGRGFTTKYPADMVEPETLYDIFADNTYQKAGETAYQARCGFFFPKSNSFGILGAVFVPTKVLPKEFRDVFLAHGFEMVHLGMKINSSYTVRKKGIPTHLDDYTEANINILKAHVKDYQESIKRNDSQERKRPRDE